MVLNLCGRDAVADCAESRSGSTLGVVLHRVEGERRGGAVRGLMFPKEALFELRPGVVLVVGGPSSPPHMVQLWSCSSGSLSCDPSLEKGKSITKDLYSHSSSLNPSLS
ncbi:hypothetical protein E2C01_075071 [Portunus trituberculatus]|uniref:Uncharacterized protein n=1 Tax=Portunus trituberculatus TaxID=210409 RepID=A0A5B7I542_PORTR|nr:hypothetical protein [Portunus trituberculatus]